MGLNRTDDSATFIVEAENKNALKVTCSLAVNPNPDTWIQRHILELVQ